MKVVFCTPTRDRPHPAYIAAMEASVPALDAASIEHFVVTEVGSAYISWARANMVAYTAWVWITAPISG